jgi:hypothetical protein
MGLKSALCVDLQEIIIEKKKTINVNNATFLVTFFMDIIKSNANLNTLF